MAFPNVQIKYLMSRKKRNVKNAVCSLNFSFLLYQGGKLRFDQGLETSLLKRSPACKAHNIAKNEQHTCLIQEARVVRGLKRLDGSMTFML